MKFLSVDIETTGLNPMSCQILQIGLVVADTKVGIISERQWLLQQECIVGEPIALAMNANLLEAIGEKKGIPPSLSRFQIQEYVREHFGDQAVTAAGKNFGSFDLQFIKQNWPDLKVNFRPRFLDPGMLYLLPTDDVVPNLGVCKERAMMPSKVAHTAVEDARDVAELIIRKLNPNWRPA